MANNQAQKKKEALDIEVKAQDMHDEDLVSISSLF